MNRSLKDLAHEDDLEPTPTHRVNFILRCWIDKTKQAHAYVIDVRSGVSYPVARLADLPQALERLLFLGIHEEDTSPPEQSGQAS